MNQELELTCTVIVVRTHYTFFGDVLVAVAVVACVRSLLYLRLRWFYKACLPFLEKKMLLNSSEGRSPGGFGFKQVKNKTKQHKVIEAAG